MKSYNISVRLPEPLYNEVCNRRDAATKASGVEISLGQITRRLLEQAVLIPLTPPSPKPRRSSKSRSKP